MKIARLTWLSSVVVVAMGMLSVAGASAAESSNPLFLPVDNQTFTAEGGPNTEKANATEIITCQKSTASGTITSALLLGKLFVHYLECTAVEKESATTRCTIKSTGAEGESLIITKELHGILGLILSPAPLDTGILFLPVSNKIFVKLAESKNGSIRCTPEESFSGRVAALITPIGTDTTKGLIVFPKGSIKRSI